MMPGFQVSTTDGTVVGGMRGLGSGLYTIPAQDTEYYYKYMWEIFDMLGMCGIDNQLMHLRDCVLPTFTVNQDTYTGSSLEYKWAKSVTWDDVKVTWYDTKGMIDIMRKWRRSVWTAKDGLQTASSYKKHSEVNVFLPNGESIVSWCLIGSWPKVIRQGEMTYTSSDAKLVEVTISYDWAEEQSCVKTDV